MKIETTVTLKSVPESIHYELMDAIIAAARAENPHLDFESDEVGLHIGKFAVIADINKY